MSPTHRPTLPPGYIPGTRFYYRLSRPLGHCVAGRMALANSSATTRNLTCDLPVCTAVQLCHRVPPYTALTELSVTEVGTVYGAVRNTALNIISIHFRLKGQIPVNYRNLFKLYAPRSWADNVHLTRERESAFCKTLRYSFTTRRWFLVSAFAPSKRVYYYYYYYYYYYVILTSCKPVNRCSIPGKNNLFTTVT